MNQDPTKYNSKKPCRKCGSTLRYICNRNCVTCKHEYVKSSLCRTKERKYEKSPKRKEAKRRWRLKQYDSTPEEYQQLLIRQNHKCAICHFGFDDSVRQTTPHIDHNHKTGKIRGLLCNTCNRAIGLLHDSEAICKSAAVYLSLT